jgi:hypothetical protein
MAKKKKTRPPRLVLLDTRQLAQLEEHIAHMLAQREMVGEVLRDIGEATTMLRAELEAARGVFPRLLECAGILKALADKRSSAAKKANATRQAEQLPPQDDDPAVSNHAADLPAGAE